MKKAKIMLTAITVLAIVGGALAFKARTFSSQYCTTLTTSANAITACPNFLEDAKTIASGAALGRFYYTISPDGSCFVFARFITCGPSPISKLITDVE